MASLVSSRRFSTLQTEPLRNFKFHVTFSPVNGNGASTADGFDENIMGGFTSVSGLTMTTEPIAYREGGYNTSVHQMAGITTFSPIGLQRGVMYGQNQGLNAMSKTFSATTGGLNGPSPVVTGLENYRYDLDIYVLHHPRDMSVLSSGNVQDAAMHFKVFNAWLTTVSFSDLNAGENGFLVEQMAWVHEGWEAAVAKTIT